MSPLAPIIVQGGNIEIQCLYSGKISWILNGINTLPNNMHPKENNSLLVLDVNSHNTGIVECISEAYSEDHFRAKTFLQMIRNYYIFNKYLLSHVFVNFICKFSNTFQKELMS